MKIVHTSDWHAGRVWKNVRRLDELEAVLDNLALYVERENVDVLLVSGDVFDTTTPVADAEKVVFRFLRRMGDLGARSVVIAGNHDSPTRLAAWGHFAELAHVHVVARPARADEGGIVRLVTKSGESATVAALPFASMKDIVSSMQLAESDTGAHQAYADGMRAMFEHLCAKFERTTVNLLVAHTHLQAATLSGSERKVHVGEQWATTAQALPAGAHYVALGHIHKPQTVNAPSPTEYAGSPLQLDFGEQDDEKSFVVVEAKAGTPSKIGRVPYRGGKKLSTVSGTLQELEARSDQLRAAGWLRVRLAAPKREPDLAGKVRRLLDNAVVVDLVLPEQADGPTQAARPSADAPPRDLFRAYYASKHGHEPEPVVLDTFDRLLSETDPERAT